MQNFNQERAQYQQLAIDAENECLAIICEAFSPRFFANIKKSTVDNSS
jgi:hypothetical protein